MRLADENCKFAVEGWHFGPIGYTEVVRGPFRQRPPGSRSDLTTTIAMSTPKPAPDAPPIPVMQVTRYDLVSSLLMAVTGGLSVCAAIVGFAWFATRLPKPNPPVPVEIIESPGGAPDGFLGETLRVDSPAEESPDAAPGEVSNEESEVEATLDSVTEMADEAVIQTEKQFELGARPATTGKPGSAHGIGRKALGQGPGVGGFPREQRWFIRYADQQTLEEYGRQLDFFGVELGAIVDGKLAYLAKLSAERPVLRTTTSGAAENRLYMTWQGGGRRTADLQLFQRAGIDVGGGLIFQFYPKNTENILARLELDYKNRRAMEIRRTYFAVRKIAAGYEFYVTRQTLLTAQRGGE